MTFVHVDVDNLWIYEGEYGVQISARQDLVYTQALPRMLELFDRFAVKATFFIVGKDLEHAYARDLVSDCISRGHEIANHTYSHLQAWHRLTASEKASEIERCERAIEAAVGVRPVGFRAPGYYLDDDIIDILMEREYVYDSSVLPSLANTLMGAYVSFRAGSRLDKAFGRRRYALSSQAVSRIERTRFPERTLLELPISTVPLLRCPMHSTFVFLLGEKYLRLVTRSLRKQKAKAVYLFHAIDTLDHPDPGALGEKVIPLRLSLARRLSMLEQLLAAIGDKATTTSREALVGSDVGGYPRSILLNRPMRAAPAKAGQASVADTNTS